MRRIVPSMAIRSNAVTAFMTLERQQPSVTFMAASRVWHVVESQRKRKQLIRRRAAYQ